MLSTQRVSAPMLPVEVCLNVLKVLPVDEVQRVLDAILAMLDQAELTHLMGDVLRRYMATDQFKLKTFIPDDCGVQLMLAMKNLQVENEKNLVYLLSVWLASKWQRGEKDLRDVRLGEFMELTEQNTDQDVLEESNFGDLGQVEFETSDVTTPAVQVELNPVKKGKKRGRKPKALKEDREIVIEVKQESTDDQELFGTVDNDGNRRSMRKNKGKNPHLDELKASDDENEPGGVEDNSDDEWKANLEGDQGTGSPVVKLETVQGSATENDKKMKRKKPSTNTTAERIKKDGLPCNVCSFVAKNYIQYKKHLSTHEDEPWPRCNVCKKLKLFESEEKLAEHHKEKHGPFVCEQCDRTFSCKQALVKHGVQHGDVPLFQCSYCDRGFSNSYSVKMHENVQHKGIKPFLCTQCGNGFTSKMSLTEHMNMHNGLKPFHCKICDIKFARKSTLRLHNINEHNEKTMNVKCPTCGKIYRNIYILNAHMKLHTSGKTEPKDQPTCDICGRKFKGKFELRKHVKVVHLHIKEFVCQTCGKQFSTRVHLNEHIATHTREAQFFCEICGKGFIHRVTYKAHVFRHSGEKQCECPICHKRFDVPRFLTRHIKDVHRNVPMPELPKYEVPRSRLAKHLRKPRKYVKPVVPPVEAAMGCEKMRPTSLDANRQKLQVDAVEEHVEILDQEMYDALGPEVVENMEVIDASDLNQPQIIQILDEMAEIDQREGVFVEQAVPSQEFEIVQEDTEDFELITAQNEIVAVGGDGDEVSATEVSAESYKVLEIEIDGELNTIQVPQDAQFVQVGDRLISLQGIQ